MQHLEGSGTPVLYMGRKVLKGYCQFVCVTGALTRALTQLLVSTKV